MASFTEEEEMDSLFEGMELFNPSDVPSGSPPHDQQPTPLPSPSPPPPQKQLQPSFSSSSIPFDENLFSDLTLITPIDTQSVDIQPELSTTTKTTLEPSLSITRQVSRKKKKAGIRIGYGRDPTSLPDESSPSSQLQQDPNSLPIKLNSPLSIPSESPSSAPIIESEVQVETNFEDTHGEIPPPVSTIRSERHGESDCEDTHVEIRASMLTIEVEDLEKNDFDGTEGENGLNSDNGDVNHGDDVGISGFSSDRLEQIRGRISEKLEKIRGMATTVSATRKELARKRRKTVECVNLASSRYKELEKELEEACETEDFEKAERVSESLAAAEKEKEEYLITLRDAEADCDSSELKMQEILELQIAAEEEGVSLLEQFAKDAEDNANLVLRNTEEISSRETIEWLSSIEALEVKKMELEIESHLINDARSGLNGSIEHVIEDDRKEQEFFYKKRDLLKDELETLLALVRQKEAEIVENDSNIQVVEKRIAGAVSGFHEVQSSIEKKYYEMQSVISKIDSERETLSKKKEKIDDFLSQEEKRGRELKELANVSMDEAKACQELVALRKSLALPILKYRMVKLGLGKTEAEILEEVQILRQEVSAARASLQELSSARSNIQQEITSAKQRIFFIDKRSPELEAEKRVAASARNFKEAGRIAAEVKAFGVEKEGRQTKMDADILQLEKIGEEINNTVKILNDKEQLILSKEKEAAMSGCERLRLVYATAMAERSAAIELGDLEEANTLLEEAEAADSEARQLQQAYDLKEEEFQNTAKNLISLELVANLGRKQLAEMAASISLPAI